MQPAKLFCLFFHILFLFVFSVEISNGFSPEKLECIAPAKPGGGHDIICHLLVGTLEDSLLVDVPMSIRYMPGGIGALAYNYIISQHADDPKIVVAASTGSALNLALHKFGNYSETDVKWLAAVGTDFGIIAVRSDSKLNSLDDLTDSLKKNPSSLVFGAAGSIGSQDWMKAALTLDSKGIDPMQIRYISYEGGGESVAALLKGHIHVFPGDLTEVAGPLEKGDVKVLAVFSEQRLDGLYHAIPTAREQGYDVVWPVWRGYYMGPKISEDEYQWWKNTINRLLATEVFQAQRSQVPLFPFAVVGEEFDTYVQRSVERMRQIAQKFDLLQ